MHTLLKQNFFLIEELAALAAVRRPGDSSPAVSGVGGCGRGGSGDRDLGGRGVSQEREFPIGLGIASSKFDFSLKLC